MRTKLSIGAPILVAVFAGAAASTITVGWTIFNEPIISSAQAQTEDWQKVDEVLGRKPAVSGDVHRYGFPRSDLTVTLDGVTIKPSLALGGWIAFKPAHGGAMAMGDLVLLEPEVRPVMAKLMEGGFEITAVHNHLLRANPATFYMHVSGHGDPLKMASVIHDALAPRSSIRSLASRARTMAACTRLPFRVAIRSAKEEWKLRLSAQWGLRRPSTFSRLVVARRRSREISC